MDYILTALASTLLLLLQPFACYGLSPPAQNAGGQPGPGLIPGLTAPPQGTNTSFGLGNTQNLTLQYRIQRRWRPLNEWPFDEIHRAENQERPGGPWHQFRFHFSHAVPTPIADEDEWKTLNHAMDGFSRIRPQGPYPMHIRHNDFPARWLELQGVLVSAALPPARADDILEEMMGIFSPWDGGEHDEGFLRGRPARNMLIGVEYNLDGRWVHVARFALQVLPKPDRAPVNIPHMPFQRHFHEEHPSGYLDFHRTPWDPSYGPVYSRYEMLEALAELRHRFQHVDSNRHLELGDRYIQKHTSSDVYSLDFSANNERQDFTYGLLKHTLDVINVAVYSYGVWNTKIDIILHDQKMGEVLM